MQMTQGDHWHCTNRECGCEIAVERSAKLEGANPVCVCGGKMKRKYIRPSAACLELLHDELLATAADQPHQD